MKRRLQPATGFVLAGLLAATAASAAGVEKSEFSTKETRAVMHAYARCVVKRQPRKAAEAILADLSEGDILHHYSSLIIGDCLAAVGGEATQMSFKGDLYTYALADALVARELAAVPPPALEGVPVLSHREPGEEPRPTDAKGKRLPAARYRGELEGYRNRVVFGFLSKYGECIVRFAPPEAKALLMTAPDSAEETAAFGRLRPALSECMPVGRTISFGRVALRGGIAINYYRLAHAAGAAAPGRAG